MKKKQYKKFALIGTSCVGKTTLLHQLEKLLKKQFINKEIAIVPEAARNYLKKRKIKNPFLYVHQSRIQNLAKKLEQKAKINMPDIIICDRSVLDAIAYIKTLGTQKETDKLISKAQDWLNTYTHFFLLDPTGIDYKTDLIRKESIKTRDLFHLSFLDLVKSLNLPYTLISGNKKERLNKITIIISSNI